jgi:hypothetical protein
LIAMTCGRTCTPLIVFHPLASISPQRSFLGSIADLLHVAVRAALHGGDVSAKAGGGPQARTANRLMAAGKTKLLVVLVAIFTYDICFSSLYWIAGRSITLSAMDWLYNTSPQAVARFPPI